MKISKKDIIIIIAIIIGIILVIIPEPATTLVGAGIVVAAIAAWGIT